MTPQEWIKGALPCPFCGASPDFGPKDPEREGTAWATVFCRDEDCPANQGANVTNMDDDENFHPVEEAVKLWNKRSAPEGAAHLAAALEEIAELKKRVDAAESFAESMRLNRDEVLRSSQQDANDAARLKLVVHSVHAAIGNEVSR